MLYILGWLVFGLVVGLISKFLHPGEDPVGFIPTVGIGIAGSFIGGGVQWLVNLGSGGFHTAGWLFSVAGGIMFCWIYRRYRLNRFFKIQGRMPGNIIHKK